MNLLKQFPSLFHYEDEGVLDYCMIQKCSFEVFLEEAEACFHVFLAGFADIGRTCHEIAN